MHCVVQAICTEAFCYPLDLEGPDESTEEGQSEAEDASSLGLSNLDSSPLRVYLANSPPLKVYLAKPRKGQPRNKFQNHRELAYCNLYSSS